MAEIGSAFLKIQPDTSGLNTRMAGLAAVADYVVVAWVS